MTTNKNIKNSRVILGEASESDSDSECNDIGHKNKNFVQENVVSEENHVEEHNEQNKIQSIPEITRDNLELIRSNIAMRSKICSWTDKQVDNAYKELTSTSKQLLRSEFIIQDTISSLNVLRQNTRHLQKTLTAITTTNFFPYVKFGSLLKENS